MAKKKTTKRMNNPDDALTKRQLAYAGDVIHQFHNLPGEYLRPLVNEYPDVDGVVPRFDGSYLINLNGKKCVVNFEDESSYVGLRTLKKIDGYRVNLEYGEKSSVISVIRTPLPLHKCLKYYWKSKSLLFAPLIISMLDFDGRLILSNISEKINNNEIISKVEAMNLVMLPKMFSKNQEIILEKVCKLLRKLKVEDKDYKYELVLEMRCVIHKFAKTIDDINRLEGVIGLEESMTAMEFQRKLLEEKFFNDGIMKGKQDGKLALARQLVDTFGIDEMVKATGFSKDELLGK